MYSRQFESGAPTAAIFIIQVIDPKIYRFEAYCFMSKFIFVLFLIIYSFLSYLLLRFCR